jgi:plasmid stabilization system protein ParE
MVPLKLQFVQRAATQLNEILSFIALDNPEAAGKISEQVIDLLEKVREYPNMGKVVFRKMPYREVQAYPCRIIYRRLEKVILVVAVIRGEQLLRRSMLTN